MQFVKDIDFDTIIPFNEQLVGFPKYLKDFGDSTAPNYCVADSKDLSKVYYPLVTGLNLLGFIEFDFAEHLIIHTKELWKLVASANLSKDIYVLLEDVLAKYYSWAEIGRKPVCFDVKLLSKVNWIDCKTISKALNKWTIKATKYNILGRSTCSLIEQYIHSFLTTSKTVGVVKSSRFIDSFPVLFFQVSILGDAKELALSQLEEIKPSEEPLETYNLAFRVSDNDVCYLDVFEKDFELIKELFSFNGYIIEEVF